MPRCPFALWLPVDFAGELGFHQPRRLLLHTNGGPGDVGSLRGYFSNHWRQTGQRIGSHFQVDLDGTIGQYVDTGRVTFTAWAADPGSISIETQDNGVAGIPWTPAQLDSLIRLGRWIRSVHPAIPPVKCPSPAGAGVGGHQLYREWNVSVHNCPGAVRSGQLYTRLLPALAAPQEAPLSATEVTAINKHTDEAAARVMVHVDRLYRLLAHPSKDGRANLDALRADLVAAGVIPAQTTLPWVPPAAAAAAEVSASEA